MPTSHLWGLFGHQISLCRITQSAVEGEVGFSFFFPFVSLFHFFPFFYFFFSSSSLISTTSSMTWLLSLPYQQFFKFGFAAFLGESRGQLFHHFASQKTNKTNKTNKKQSISTLFLQPLFPPNSVKDFLLPVPFHINFVSPI